jgi:hypothetical protein
MMGGSVAAVRLAFMDFTVQHHPWSELQDKDILSAVRYERVQHGSF